MDLGCFSVSLAVKDLGKSKAFYENMGFSVFGGDEEQGWLIMKSGSSNIGLFQGMFDRNILTFNPGWDQNASELSHYEDVRALQDHLKKAGLKLDSEAEGVDGPGSFTLTDPDGNTILIDQHRETSVK